MSRGDPETFPRIKEAFEEAIALDPKFALPYCEYGLYFIGMANVGLLPFNQAMPIVRTHAGKALDLDPSIPEGHAMMGVVAGTYDLDWQEAERRFRLAMARDPVPPLVRELHATNYLTCLGRTQEAAQEMERALQEDPLNLIFRIIRALLLFAAGRADDASGEARKILELNPGLAAAYAVLGIGHLLRGELEEALAMIEKEYALMPLGPRAIGTLAGLLQRTGDTRRAEEVLQKLPADAFGGPRARAMFHWVCGDIDATADWFEKAIDQRDAMVLFMLRLWYARELRSTPHWPRLMRKLNLP